MATTDRTAPTVEALRARRQEIIQIASSRGARNVRVFGSFARGDAVEESDVDLLVGMDKDRSALDLSELILDLETALGRPVDIVEIREPSLTAERILAESVPL